MRGALLLARVVYVGLYGALAYMLGGDVPSFTGHSPPAGG
jgi:hypothetical protein